MLMYETVSEMWKCKHAAYSYAGDKLLLRECIEFCAQNLCVLEFMKSNIDEDGDQDRGKLFEFLDGDIGKWWSDGVFREGEGKEWYGMPRWHKGDIVYCLAMSSVEAWSKAVEVLWWISDCRVKMNSGRLIDAALMPDMRVEGMGKMLDVMLRCGGEDMVIREFVNRGKREMSVRRPSSKYMKYVNSLMDGASFRLKVGNFKKSNSLDRVASQVMMKCDHLVYRRDKDHEESVMGLVWSNNKKKNMNVSSPIIGLFLARYGAFIVECAEKHCNLILKPAESDSRYFIDYLGKGEIKTRDDQLYHYYLESFVATVMVRCDDETRQTFASEATYTFQSFAQYQAEEIAHVNDPLNGSSNVFDLNRVFIVNFFVKLSMYMDKLDLRDKPIIKKTYNITR